MTTELYAKELPRSFPSLMFYEVLIVIVSEMFLLRKTHSKWNSNNKYNILLKFNSHVYFMEAKT